MKIKGIFILFLVSILGIRNAAPQTIVKNENASVRAEVSEKGIVNNLFLNTYNKDAHVIKFRNDSLGGPSLVLNGVTVELIKKTDYTYGATVGPIEFSISYSANDSRFKVLVEAKNTSDKSLENVNLSLRMGLNTEMIKYPDWHKAFFPTLLRAEKTHFWGYLMSPDARIISVSSPDPIASYRLYYNNHKLFGHGHLIRTFSLDLLHTGKQPERHPQGLSGFKSKEKKQWTIYLEEVESLDKLKQIVSKSINAPMIQSDQYTIRNSESTKIDVFSKNKPEVTLLKPNGEYVSIKKLEKNSSVYSFTFDYTDGGVYTIFARDPKSNRVSESKISVLTNNYSDYIKSARRAAIKYPQQASSHTESWYGLFSGYIAAENFPDAEYDKLIDEKLEEIYPLLYDTITNIPTYFMDRIQNHALMAALYAQKYRASQNIKDLQRAADLSDYILSKQSPDGAFRSGKTHYTAVIYIAKALMDVMKEEKVLAKSSSEWEYKYQKHYHAVKRSIDELAKNLDNIQTEGEMTFEDGMISCSYTQISQFALLLPESDPERQKYINAAEKLVDMHQCLSQIVIPDSRMNGGSMRYWEAQYDILSGPNMMNSPHGWSAWRIYGLKNLYELTGKAEYLHQMMNAIGSCIQLLDPKTDKLNWAFIVDPYINADLFVKSKDDSSKGVYEKHVIGEQYLPMISDWNKPKLNTRVTGYWGYDGGKCDNDVHEIFKCLGEILLNNCYVIENEDGSVTGYNCKVKKSGDSVEVTPAERTIKNVHYNVNKINSLNCNGFKNDLRNSKKGWIAVH